MVHIQMKKIFLAVALLVPFVASATYVPLPSDASLTIGGTRSAFGQMLDRMTTAGVEEMVFGTSAGASGVPLTETAGAAIASDGSAALTVSRAANLATSSGVAVPVTVAGRFAVSRVAPIIGAAMAGPLGTAAVYVALAAEIGYQLAPSSSGGAPTVGKVDPTQCTVAPCTVYLPNSAWEYDLYITGNYIYQDQWLADVKSRPAFAGQNCYWGGYYPICQASNGNMTYIGASASHTTSVPEVSKPTPSSITELTNAIAAKSGWPSSSVIAAATAAALSSTGSSLAPDTPTSAAPNPVTVTGPASTPVSTVTTINPDGSKSVVTTTANRTYSGPFVTTTNNSTNNTYNTSNVITSTTTTSSTVSAPATQPQNDCQTNPTSAACTEIGTVPTADTISKKNVPMTLVAQAFATSSGCPPPVTFTAGGKTYSIGYELLCGWLAQVKPIVMALGALSAAWIMADSFRVS